MAMPTTSPAPPPSAQVVGNAFVEQYYHILHQSPELVYRFYQDSSVLSRPEANGMMASVTTMQAINDKILSMDYKDYKAEIKTADSQDSYKDGVLVLVTGCLTGKDSLKRKFTQSFFLAPQDKGYFVLNDVFRYVDEEEPLEASPVVDNGVTESTPTAALAPDPEASHTPELPTEDTSISIVEGGLDNGEVYDPSHDEDWSAEVEVIAELSAHSSETESHPVTEPASSVPQEDAPKKSYASILKDMKGTAASTPVNVPAKFTRVAPVNVRQNLIAHAAPAPAPAPAPVPEPVTTISSKAPENNIAPENEHPQEEVEGYSIYIRNLPMNATPAQVEDEFQKFGSIKPGGVQVRSNKQQGFCFGFVEFESLSSVNSALEASPIKVGGRQAFVEKKRTTSRVGTGRERFPPGRVGSRNDNFRGRGNFGGAGGYGRNEFGSRGDTSGRVRSLSGRGSGEGYQRFDQNENARGGRQGSS